MRIAFRCDTQTVWLDAPDTATVYASRYPAPNASADTLVQAALAAPIGSAPLRDALARHPGATCALLPEGPYCAPLSAT